MSMDEMLSKAKEIGSKTSDIAVDFAKKTKDIAAGVAGKTKDTVVEISPKVKDFIVEESSAIYKNFAKGLGKVNTKISDLIKTSKELKKENLELRKILENNTITESIKQKVIIQLNSKIKFLTEQLKIERERNTKNEELIALLQSQIEDFELTLKTAENANVG